MARQNDNNKPTNYWARTGYGDLTSWEGDAPPSRLTESTAVLRATLSSRNLYTQFKQYPLEESDRQKVVNTISTVLGTIAPFKSFNLTNSALGRLASLPTTPLSEIGLIMLGKQLTNNFKSNMGQEYFPQMSLRNVFDGNPETKLFQRNIDFRITKGEVTGSLENFVDKVFDFNPRRESPFKENPSNKEYLQNTGSAQLDYLFGKSIPDNKGGINKNIYKPVSTSFTDYSDAATASKNEIFDRSSLLGNDRKIFFNFSNKIVNKGSSLLNRFNPYSPFSVDDQAEDDANKAMVGSYNKTAKDSGTQEYAPDKAFINTNLGKTTQIVEPDMFSDISQVTGFRDEIKDKLVWGRDGVNAKANENLVYLRGSLGEERYSVSSNNTDLETKFNGKTGLLKYTAELLNATKGQTVDQTRKIFRTQTPDGTKYTSFNGSGLFKAPVNSLFKGAWGLRQHSPLDQYDRFAKAIRFEGNHVYAGNPDSVVYNSVMPRIHPSINSETGVLEKKNLTFSIENLAIGVFEDPTGNYGMLDDGEGTLIPKCEEGPFGGRLMWFPPYIENLNEVAIANHDTVVMVGRNEPIYSYMHSERTANLTFKMIIDYPEHAKNFTNFRDMAEFFAFGGEEYRKPPVQKPVKPTPDPDPTPLIPDVTIPTKTIFSFPNDVPKKGTTANYALIDSLYNVVKYDIKKGLDNTADTDSFTINDKVFLVTGVTPTENGKYELTVPVGFSQSQARYIAGARKLDDDIYNVFNSSENYKYYEIRIVGSATQLYTESIKDDVAATNAFNTALGKRRADTMAEFVKQRITKVLGKPFASTKINIITETIGAKSPKYDKKSDIPLEGAKLERLATIYFQPREATTEAKEGNPTSEEQREKESQQISDQNAQATSNISKKDANCVLNERGITEDAILGDFKSITKNYFYPAFHSQTPEDFHKRLTFLQQCVRQGSAIRSNPEVDGYGITRAKNSVFGRQPVCILRIGDFFYTKVIINNVTIDYDENIWDTNPEGMGMQPMIANVTLQMKVIGGQSLKGPIDALQNAVAFNYYANSTFAKNGEKGIYTKASKAAEDQQAYNDGITTGNVQTTNNNK